MDDKKKFPLSLDGEGLEEIRDSGRVQGSIIITGNCNSSLLKLVLTEVHHLHADNTLIVKTYAVPNTNHSSSKPIEDIATDAENSESKRMEEIVPSATASSTESIESIEVEILEEKITKLSDIPQVSTRIISLQNSSISIAVHPKNNDTWKAINTNSHLRGEKTESAKQVLQDIVDGLAFEYTIN